MTNLTNSNTPNKTTQSSNQPLPFKVGQKVLCPSLGLGLDLFMLRKSSYNDLVAIHAHGSVILYDMDGFFIHAGDAQKGDFETNDYAPSLFTHTPANRQAIATLYQCKGDVNVIDITEPVDNEIVKVPSVLLSDIACEAAIALLMFNDLSTLLYMVMNGQLLPHQVTTFTRLAYEALPSCSDAQAANVNTLNKALQHSKFGIVEVSA